MMKHGDKVLAREIMTQVNNNNKKQTNKKYLDDHCSYTYSEVYLLVAYHLSSFRRWRT